MTEIRLQRRITGTAEDTMLDHYAQRASESLSGHATDITVRFLQYFWIAEYRTR